MNDTKKKIISYAQKRFMSEGFYKISMDDFARNLRMSKKTIYECYSSKEQIVREATLDFFICRKNEVSVILASDTNAVQMMTAILRVILNAVKNLNSTFLNDLRLHLPEIWDEVDDFRTAFMRKNFAVIIEKGIGEGLFRKVNEEVVLHLIISSLRSVIQPDFLLNSSLAPKEIIFESFEFIISGLATPEGKAVFNNSIKETAL